MKDVKEARLDEIEQAQPSAYGFGDAADSLVGERGRLRQICGDLLRLFLADALLVAEVNTSRRLPLIT
jgi:hypothetical protein